MGSEMCIRDSLWKMAFVGSFLSSLESVTASSSLRDRVRELNELVMFVVDAACGPIKGTPLYSGVLRLFGMRVGGKVCWLGERCPEPDLLSVGDGTLVAPGVDFFTHNREAKSYAFEVSCACQDGAGPGWYYSRKQLLSCVCSQPPCSRAACAPAYRSPSSLATTACLASGLPSVSYTHLTLPTKA